MKFVARIQEEIATISMHFLTYQGNALLGSQFVLAWVLQSGPSAYRLDISLDTNKINHGLGTGIV